MGTVLSFPQHRARQSASGVRVARITDHWFIERAEVGRVTDRRPMPLMTDAQRIATRISRRDKVPLLAPCVPCPSRRTGAHSTPNDAA